MNNTARLMYALRDFAWVCVGTALIIPFVAGLIWDLQTAANVAQLASLPLAAAGLLGTSLIPTRGGQSATTLATPVGGPALPSLGPSSQAQVTPSSSTAARLGLLRYLGIGAGVVLTTLSALTWVNFVSGKPVNQDQLIPQPLVVLSGPRPVIFEGGTDWRWLDLKTGTTTVILSPGGEKKNDGLRELGGVIDLIGNCAKSDDNKVTWSFKADGHSIADTYTGASVTLPDHVDVLTLEITAVIRDGCSMALSWHYPSVMRAGLAPE